MSKSVSALDPTSGRKHSLVVKGFLRGALHGDAPTVVLVVKSDYGEVLGHFEITPQNAQIFAEYVRQEAELASIAEEENQA